MRLSEEILLTYYLALYTVAMDTVVNNWETLIGEFIIRKWRLISRVMLLYSKCVKICWLLVVFTRVRSVKGSPAIRGDTGLIEVGTVGGLGGTTGSA